ncbi:MAG: hypothetical protein M3Q27_05400 [Actinomycetota bacterium]|nr:hypothetical protein [Actinomycetota bacterium]
MHIETVSADEGRMQQRTRFGAVERVWVRDVILRCSDVDRPSVLLAVVRMIPDASEPVRAPGGGWKITIGVPVSTQQMFETPTMTAARAVKALRLAYERELTLA